MGEWHVGDPVGFGNDIGAPEVSYLDYANAKRETQRKDSPLIDRARSIGREASILEREGKYDMALVFIDRALELVSEDAVNLAIKAKILESSGRREEALKYYHESLKIEGSISVRSNKANCLYRMAMDKHSQSLEGEALDYINEALKILPGNDKKSDCLLLKSEILSSMGDFTEAKKCLIQSGCRVEKPKNNIGEDMICIAGTQFYKGTDPFREGLTVELFREAGNDYDSDAIRVEIDGETVGYVANSANTLVDGVKSASQLRGMFRNKMKARITSIDSDSHVIAKLDKSSIDYI